ncbi:acyl-CoA dehydrogenase family protein [Ramlibacter henchirensis]|nr:acyl-CoA dehydrogenase family protein [Ramlibacter henchirensis]
MNNPPRAADPSANAADSVTEDLRDSVRDVLREQCSLGHVRRIVDGDREPEQALLRIAAELGWMGVALPEDQGGSGLGYGALCALYEELGRHLAPLPLLPLAMCIEALATCHSPELKRHLPPLVAGECSATVSSLDQAFDARAVRLRRLGSALQLHGRLSGLQGATDAALLLLFARDEEGALHVLLLDPRRDGVTLVDRGSSDLTRTLCSADLDGLEVSADRLLVGVDAEALAERLLSHACLALASDAMGGAAAIFELTVDYLRTRHQFGRAIGSFQAIKHRAADLKVQMEASTGLLRQAVAAADLGQASAPRLAAMAKFHACDTYARVAAEAVQMHGGIGFTWEHHCHLFLKRAKLNQQLHGRSEWHQDRIARSLSANALEVL